MENKLKTNSNGFCYTTQTQNLKMVRIISLNCRGLQDTLKRRQIFNYYRSRADIMCLQETHSDPEMEEIWRNENGGGTLVFSHGTNTARGVCTIINKSAKLKVNKIDRDQAGRTVICEISSEENPEKIFTLANIYAPNEDKPNFFVDVVQKMTNMSEDQIIIGDFNLVMDPKLDRKGSTRNNHKARNAIETIMEELLFTEILRTRNENQICYSWMRTRPEFIASRLDYALVSQAIASDIGNVMYLPGIKTDHLCFYMAFDIT